MAKVRLSILKGKVAFSALMADVEHMKKISKEKIPDFLKWIVRFRVRDEAYTDMQWEKIREQFNFRSIEELHGAQRFASVLFYRGCEIDESDLISDLQSLGFVQEKIELIMDGLRTIWVQSEDYLKRARSEAIPILTSLRWRVDIRHASGDYLKRPEVVALLRIGATDKTKRDRIYIELDKDKLSWLETVIGKIKREFLKAEEKLDQVV